MDRPITNHSHVYGVYEIEVVGDGVGKGRFFPSSQLIVLVLNCCKKWNIGVS